MTEKRVRDIMHHGVISCQADTSLAEVVRILSDTDIHALVVTGEGGEVAGILSHMDIIPHFSKDLRQITAQDVMTARVVSVSPQATLQEAIGVMKARRIHRLVVTEAVEDGKLLPVGMLSTTDIVREMRGAKWTWYV